MLVRKRGTILAEFKDEKMVVPTSAARMPMVRASSDLDDMICEPWIGEGSRSFIKRAAPWSETNSFS